MKINIRGEVIRAIDEKTFDVNRREATFNFEIDEHDFEIVMPLSKEEFEKTKLNQVVSLTLEW